MTKHRPVHTTGIKMWNVTPATYCGCLKKRGGKSYGVLCLTLYCTPILWPIDSSQNGVSIENKHETILCAQAYNATRIFRSTPLKQLVATTESYYNLNYIIQWVTITWPSAPPETKCSPSGEYFTQLTKLVWLCLEQKTKNEYIQFPLLVKIKTPWNNSRQFNTVQFNSRHSFKEQGWAKMMTPKMNNDY